MRHKLGKARYRIGLAVALAALAGLTVLCWWATPLLWEEHPGVWVAGVALIAILFALVILLIWMLHWDHRSE